MKAVVSGQWSVVSLCRRISCLGILAYYLLACSIPNLEPAACIEARTAVREFYSFHFGNDMNPSLESIELRSKHLTRSFKEFMIDRYRAGHGAKVGDEITQTVSDFPKAFRVGKCKLDESKNKAELEVLLFWKDDQRDDQRTLQVEAQQEDSKWLVNAIKLLPQ